MVADPNKPGNVIINPHYIRDLENDDFKYFVSRILPAMNPSKSKFSTSKTHSVLSDIFTPCDEAYGLLLIHNELHVWKQQEDRKHTGAEIENKEKKRFTNGKLGNGWTKQGRNLFTKLAQQIIKLRESDETGSILERVLLRTYREESGSMSNNYNGRNSDNDNGDDGNDDDFMDPKMMQIFNPPELEQI